MTHQLRSLWDLLSPFHTVTYLGLFENGVPLKKPLVNHHFFHIKIAILFSIPHFQTQLLIPSLRQTSACWKIPQCSMTFPALNLQSIRDFPAISLFLVYIFHQIAFEILIKSPKILIKKKQIKSSQKKVSTSNAKKKPLKFRWDTVASPEPPCLLPSRGFLAGRDGGI